MLDYAAVQNYLITTLPLESISPRVTSHWLVDKTNWLAASWFYQLKKSRARHIAAETHQANLVRIGEESEHSRKLAVKQQLIGITVGKQAYRLLKYCSKLMVFVCSGETYVSLL